jgi:hypothetical protein
MVLCTRAGWPGRAEASDPRWAAFEVGPVVVGMRLLGDLRELGELLNPEEGQVGTHGDTQPEPGIKAALFRDGPSRGLRRQRVAS